jgi:hypothetical protein
MTSHQGLVAAETKRNVFKGSTVPQSVGYLNEKNIFFLEAATLIFLLTVGTL